MKSASRIISEYKAQTAEGIGCGYGENYKPYLTVQNTRSRVKRGVTTLATCGERVVHYFSHAELMALLLFDWDDSVIDIREQYPLNPEDTVVIAQDLHVPHPGHTRGGVVMTTDLLVTYRSQETGERIDKAFQVKSSRTDLTERVYEKLAIEQRYWKMHNVEWQLLIADEAFPQILCFNLDYLAAWRRRRVNRSVVDEAIGQATEFLKKAADKPLCKQWNEVGCNALRQLCAIKLMRFPISKRRFYDCVPDDFSRSLQ